MPKREAKVILLCVPCSERVPPLILRLMTRWRRLRSAALLSAGTSGSATKTKSSLMWRSMRRHSLPWTTDRIAEHRTAWWVNFDLLQKGKRDCRWVNSKPATAPNRPDGSTLNCYRLWMLYDSISS